MFRHTRFLCVDVNPYVRLPQSSHVDAHLQLNPICGKRTGFVGVQNVLSVEVLNRVDAFDVHFLFGHGDCSLGEVGRQDHGQRLVRLGRDPS